MKNYLLGFLSFICLSLFSQANYESNTLIVKVKEEYRSYFFRGETSDYTLESAFSKAGVTEVKREYPHSPRPRYKKHENGIEYTDITLIYRVKYSKDINPKELVGSFMATNAFQYVEPSYLFETLYKPNDPQIDSLYYMEMMKMYDAWSTTKGDTNVVIGVSDTGFDIDHPDLVNSVKYNYADPINGIDDDGDGYIDNFRGWDLGDNDNNPQVGGNWHGIFVSGFVGATADNGFQLAGTGFNCKIVPLKIESGGALTHGYQSIVYAANHDFDVINCSWGSTNSWTQHGQDICKYSTIDKNCLVVAAAGNDDSENIWYPASFDWVLSVGGINEDKEKWISGVGSGSTYNDYVDVVAPSVHLYRVNNGGGAILGNGLGTSFSAPIVSGVAGLVKSQFPSWSAIQVLEQIKATAIDVDTVFLNSPYQGKLGKGLVNADSAVNNISHPGLIFDSGTLTDNDDDIFYPGDTVYLYGNVINVLNNSSAATRYRVTTESPYIEFIDSVENLIAIPFNDSLNTNVAPLVFVVKEDMPYNEVVSFKVFLEDGDYVNWQMITKDFNPDYKNLTDNNVKISIGAGGKLGFNGPENDQSVGLGVRYKTGSNILYKMGVIAALDDVQCSFVLDEDFTEVSGVLERVDFEADKVVYNHYNDDSAGADKLDIEIKQKTMAWNDPDRMDFIIMEMEIKNNSGSDINGMSFGVYSDWDIADYSQNHAVFDSTIKTGYCYSPSGEYAGIHLLTDSAFQHYAFDNSGANGSDEIWVSGFSSTEQYNSLSNGNSRNSAGLGDVSQSVGVGGLNILAGDSLKVAFALVLGDSYEVIKNASYEADTAYDELYNLNLSIIQNDSASCFGICDGKLAVNAKGGSGVLSYNWYDVTGTPLTDSISGVCAGVKHCEVSDEAGVKDTVEVELFEPAEVVVNLGNDTTICSGDSIFLDAGFGVSYLWSPNSEITQVILGVKDVGKYSVELTDADGCIGRDTMELFLNDLPQINFTDTVMSAGLLCDGEINGFISGGQSPYTYSWDDDLARDSIHAVNLCVGTYTLTVTDQNTCTSTDTLEIEDNTLTSISNSIVNFSIYPNPTSGTINLEGVHNNSMVEVYDLLGAKVASFIVTEQTKDLSQLFSGTYVFRISSGQNMIVKKVIFEK